MVLFDIFYKKHGINRVSHFFNPRLIDSTTVVFPFRSEVHYFKASERLENVTRKIPLFYKHPKIMCRSITSYTVSPEGIFVKLPFSFPKFYREINTDKTIRYLRPTENKLTIPKNTLLVNNYGTMTQTIRYKKSAFKDKWIFENGLRSLIENLNNQNKNNTQFVVFEVPDILPTWSKLNQFAENLTIPRLRSIPNYKYLLLLEFWKYITPKLRPNSIFNSLKEETKENFNIIFTLGKKSVFLNFSILDKVIFEYAEGKFSTESLKDLIVIDTIGDLERFGNFDLMFRDKDVSLESVKFLDRTKLKSNVFKKLFYKLMLSIIQSKEEEITNNFTEDDKETNLEEMLNKEFDFENEANNGKDENSDDIFGLKKEEDDLDEESLPNTDNDISSDVDETDIDLMTTDKKIITSITDLNNDNSKPVDEILKKINILKENKEINKKRENELKNILEEQNTKEINLEGIGFVTIGSLLDTSKDSEEDKVKPKEVKSTASVFDDSYNKNTIKSIDSQYMENNMIKDAVRSVFNLQKHGLIISEYDTSANVSILDTTIEHKIVIKQLNGSSSTIRFKSPKISPDGSFKMSGNTYRMRKQRTEIPIRKIDSRRVVLNSYYGKLFVDKAQTKSTSYGHWYLRQISNNPDITNIVAGEADITGIKLSQSYGKISKSVRGFNYNNYTLTFDYNNRLSKIKNFDPTLVERDGTVIIGYDRNQTPEECDVLLLDNNDNISVYSRKSKSTSHLTDLYSLAMVSSRAAGPIEFASIKLLGRNIPLVMLLSYYVGLDQLLKVLKIKHGIFSLEDKDGIKGFVCDNPIKVKFLDKILIFDRDFGQSDIILGALINIKDIKDTGFDSWTKRDLFGSIFATFDLPLGVQTEIRALENLFIDPMTLSLLKEMKLPETFLGLLFKAAELLKDDNFEHPNLMSGQVIKGYERINGMIYKSLVNAVKDHENRSAFSKSNITMDPFTIMTQIKDDSTTVLVDDLNPISQIKQSEDVSYLGAGGRQAISMTQRTRVAHPSEIGIISEGVKDNGQVGITAYLVPNPGIVNIRGNVKDVDASKVGWGDLLSTAALLSPFGTQDDGKRLNFVNIQSAHVVPINEMRAPAVRTGYESIIAVRADNKFCVTAEDDGEVIYLDNKKMTVKYGEKEVSYPITTWTSKEEAGSCYTHQMVPNFKVGDKFFKDDSLIYDSCFFEPDIFYKNRVIYKQGTLVNVAIMENSATYQDSGAISYKLSNRLGTKVTKVISIVVNVNDEIHNMVSIGDSVEPTDVLFNFMSSESENFGDLDDEILDILKDLKSSAPKAKVRGTIKNIVVYYNTEEEKMTKTMKKIVKESNERLLINKGAVGKVNSSYSIQGKPLLPDEIEIKIYIEVNESMSVGDKAVAGNQCKFTIGEVFSEDIVTEDGKVDVEMMFGFIGIQERIVNSPVLIGTTSTVLDLLEKEVIDIYFKP